MDTDHISIQVPRHLSHQEWRSLVCRTAIKAHFRSSEAFAKKIGVARSYVDMVIGGWVSQKRIEAALSELSGYPADTLFPPHARKRGAA